MAWEEEGEEPQVLLGVKQDGKQDTLPCQQLHPPPEHRETPRHQSERLRPSHASRRSTRQQQGAGQQV